MDKKQNVQWGIKSFAEIFDVTPRTIRFYEDKGLLSPDRSNGVRVFRPVDRIRFEKIMRGKRLGFTLGDNKEVLDVTDGHVTDRIELLRRRKNFETVINSLGRRREDLDTLANDMAEICSVIDKYLENVTERDGYLENVTERDGVFDLAEAYEAKFSQTPFVEETIDDFNPIPHDQSVMTNNIQ